MADRPRYVVDPSVFIAGLLSQRGSSSALIESWRRGECQFIASPQVLRELQETVARRPYLRTHVDPARTQRLVAELRTRAELHPDPATAPLTRDRNDDYLEALRQETGSRGVSLDKDLLDLRTPSGERPHIRPEVALEQIRQRLRQRAASHRPPQGGRTRDGDGNPLAPDHARLGRRRQVDR